MRNDGGMGVGGGNLFRPACSDGAADAPHESSEPASE